MARGKKTGGRQKGSLNKTTSDIMEIIKAQYPDYDPVLAMVKIAQARKTPVQIKAFLNREVAAYVYPKLKPQADLSPVDYEAPEIHFVEGVSFENL